MMNMTTESKREAAERLLKEGHKKLYIITMDMDVEGDLSKDYLWFIYENKTQLRQAVRKLITQFRTDKTQFPEYKELNNTLLTSRTFNTKDGVFENTARCIYTGKTIRSIFRIETVG